MTIFVHNSIINNDWAPLPPAGDRHWMAVINRSPRSTDRIKYKKRTLSTGGEALGETELPCTAERKELVSGGQPVEEPTDQPLSVRWIYAQKTNDDDIMLQRKA
jgi:hypothetical protein